MYKINNDLQKINTCHLKNRKYFFITQKYTTIGDKLYCKQMSGLYILILVSIFGIIGIVDISRVIAGKPRVVIIGGGISGLTTAHELSSTSQFDITLIEKNNDVGGLARSSEEYQKECPSEYSWRVFGEYYFNAFDILKRIPLSGNPTMTTFDNLVTFTPSSEVPETNCKAVNNFHMDVTKTTFYDKYIVINELLKTFMVSLERSRMYFGNLSWYEELHKNGLSQQGYDQYVRPLGPYLGYENEKVSIHDVSIPVQVMIKCLLGNNCEQYRITAMPINLAWFNHWREYLSNTNNVKILTGTEAIGLNYNKEDNKIQSVKLNNGNTINADYVVSAMSVESAASLISGNYELTNADGALLSLEPLAKYGRQLQLSAQIYFDKQVYLSKRVDYMYLKKSPWAIMILPEGSAWSRFSVPDFCPHGIRDIWSLGLCETHKPGRYTNKSFVDCSKEEIQYELWSEIINTPGLPESLCSEDGGNLRDVKIIDFKIWKGFYHWEDEHGNHTDVVEPKWANNKYTQQYRPGTLTKISNLFLAGAYSNTSISTHGMEGAVESGKKAAKHVLETANISSNIFLHIHERPFLFPLFPLRVIDNLLFTNGYSPLYVLTFNNAIVFIVLYLLLLTGLVSFVLFKIAKLVKSY